MNKLIATLLVCLSSSLSTFGAWTLLDDFQAFSDGQVFSSSWDIGWFAYAPNGTDEYWFLKDPYDASNVSMYVESQNYGIDYGNTWVMKGLPDGGIAPGETATLYFRCLWYGMDNEWAIGTADKDLGTSEGSNGDFNALFRIGKEQQIEHYDGDRYVQTHPSLSLAINHWYQFSMVVENSWDMSTTPPTSTGTFTLYAMGPYIGDGKTPTLIPVGSDPPKDFAYIRRAPVDADGNPQEIQWLMFATNSGPPSSPNAGDRFLLDDFYFTKEINVANQPVPDSSFTPIDQNGNVDTGNWMGWINILQSPFYWSYSLDNWIYMEDPPNTAPGVWGYFYK